MASAEEPTALSKLWLPAILLLICALLGLSAMILAAGFIALEVLLSDTLPSEPQSAVAIVFVIANLFVCALVLFGAVSMLRLRPRWGALVGAWAALIPLFGPCYLIAIPFGIWALFVLYRPDVIAAF